MGTPRHGHTAVRLLDGRVLVAGGTGYPQGGGDPDLYLTSAELYDPDSGTWTATGNMVHPYAGFDATLLRDGKVLVWVNEGDPDNEIIGAEVYDPESGTWSATGKTVTSGGRATLLRDGRVLVVGIDGAELYDPDTRTWTATGKMITPRYGPAAVLLPDGKVLAAGGDGARLVVEGGDRAPTPWTRPSCTTRTRGPGPPPRT